MLENAFVGIGLSIRIECSIPDERTRSILSSGIVVLSQDIGNKASRTWRVKSQSETLYKEKKVVPLWYTAAGVGPA